MTNRGDKALGLIKNGGAKLRSEGGKLYSLAKDPAVQAKVRNIVADGQKFYRAASSPEAKQAYKQAAEFIRKTRKS
jgi:hypothetical protein